MPEPEEPGPVPAPEESAPNGTPAAARSGQSAFRRSVGRLVGRPASKNRKPPRWWELPVLFLIAVAVAIVVKSFIVQPFYIPSQSMELTLHGCPGCNGDKILVNKPVYDFRSPHPGDIVVFSAPTGWEQESLPVQTNAVTGAFRWFGQLVGFVPPNEKDLVKRVIAVGGQTVRCCDTTGHVQISDSGPGGPWRSLNETYVYQDDHQAFGPVTVPKGRLWVLGDHRGNSADSRYHCGGEPVPCPDAVQSTVPISSVIGKAVVIAWPYGRWRTLGTPATFTNKAGALGLSAAPILSATPILSGGAVVFPLFFWRRRQRGRAQSQRRRRP